MNKVTKEQLDIWSSLKLGMFVHWGVYSVLGGEYKNQKMDYIGEWIMSKYRIPLNEYKLFAKKFNPKDFNAHDIVSLAKRNGFKYLVYTAKHHDGFAMYKSSYPYNIVDFSDFKRDPLKELELECRLQGIKLCLYYSQSLDWSEQNAGGTDPSFPKNFGMSWGNDWDFTDESNKNFDTYFQSKVITQMRELLTNYGEIFSFWFDCPLTLTDNQAKQLYDLVKELQPKCLINSRLGSGLGDFTSLGDNVVPGAIDNTKREAIITLNNTWGYKYFDNNYKSFNDLISTLSSTFSKNANLMINIGPDGNGNVPLKSIELLNKFGDWVRSNSSALYHTVGAPLKFEFEWGFCLFNSNKLYLINLSDNNSVTFTGLKNKILSASIVSSGQSILIKNNQSNFGSYTLQCGKNEIVELILDANLLIWDGIFEQSSGVINLPIVSAKINNLNNEYKLSNVIAKTDASITNETSMHVGEQGSIEGWHNNLNSVEWDIFISEKGQFKVDIITSALYHSHPWTPGNKVCVSNLNKVITNTLIQDVVVDNGYYKKVLSHIGIISLDAGKNNIKLYATNIVDDLVGFSPVSLLFTRIAS